MIKKRNEQQKNNNNEYIYKYINIYIFLSN